MGHIKEFGRLVQVDRGLFHTLVQGFLLDIDDHFRFPVHVGVKRLSGRLFCLVKCLGFLLRASESGLHFNDLSVTLHAEVHAFRDLLVGCGDAVPVHELLSALSAQTLLLMKGVLLVGLIDDGVLGVVLL